MSQKKLNILNPVEMRGTIVFKKLKQAVHYWKLGRKWKKELRRQKELYQVLGPATPPTAEQVEAFKKEWDLGWDSHMVQRVESHRTYFEASLN